MSYYAELIDGLFTHFAVQGENRSIAITHQMLREHPDGELEETEHRVNLPEGLERFELPGTEEFFPRLEEISARRSKQNIFIHVPILRRKLIPPSQAKSSPSLSWESEAIDVARRNKISGTLIVLVREHFLADPRHREWRLRLFTENEVTVIEHSADGHGVISDLPGDFLVRFVTLVIHPEPGPTRFVKTPDEMVASGRKEFVKDVRRLLKQPAGRSKFGYVYSGRLDPSSALLYDNYSPETQLKRSEIAELGDRVPLGEVMDVLMGFRPSREANVVECLAVHAKCITSEGRIDVESAEPLQRSGHVINYLQDEDICISKIGKRDGGLSVGIFKCDGRKITFGISIIVVRSKPTLSSGQRSVIVAFLKSPLAQSLMHLDGSVLGKMVHVAPAALLRFPVPLSASELITALEQLSNAKTAFQAWISEIESAEGAIVSEASAKAAKSIILNSGQLARQRHRAAEQVESLDHRIHTQFPYPLAYVWREQLVEKRNSLYHIRAILKAAESHTAFLAFIAITSAHEAEFNLGSVDSLAQSLSTKKSGTSFGNWVEIVREFYAQKSGNDQHVPFAQLLSLNVDGEWERAVRKLMGIRNDDSHGRLSKSNLKEVIDEATSSIRTLFQCSEFLTDYRLRLVIETKYRSIRDETTYQFRDLSGDHPLAPIDQDIVAGSKIERDSLYLRDRDGQIYRLRPLLNYLECPECHQMSTFYLDSYSRGDDGQQVSLKSIERSSIRRENLYPDFQHVGLLN